MAVCPNCQTQVAQGGAFCPSCGSNMAASQAPRSGGLHCPQCKSTNISPINETSVNGALTTSRGRMSATTVSNTHRNYWMCAHCGNKFRNIQNLEEEIEKMKKQTGVAIVSGFICLIISILLIMALMKDTWMVLFAGMFTFTFVIATLVCFGLALSYKGKVKKMEKERDYLKVHCFN